MSSGPDPAAKDRQPPGPHGPFEVMALVELAQNGDSESFASLYSLYRDTVQQYIHYRVGVAATAEDLTNETFVRAIRHIGTFTYEGRDFGAWLVTIARNLVNDHFSSGWFRREVTVAEAHDTGAMVDDVAEALLLSERNLILLGILDRLPARTGAVARLYVTGVSTGEIAARLGIAPSTVRVHLHLLRRRLRMMPGLRDELRPA